MATATYGITDSGFIKRRMTDISAEIADTLRQRFGGDVATQPDTVLGQIISTFAEREAALWEMAEGVYNAMYPATASGSSLDKAVSFTGVTRLQATRSQLYCVLYGQEGTVVPAGSSAPQAAGQTRFTLAADTEITAEAVADVSIAVTAAAVGQSYAVIIGSDSYRITAASAAQDAILAQLVTQIAAAGYSVSASGTGTDARLRIVTDGRMTLSVDISSNLGLAEIGTPGLFLSRDYGAYEAPAGSVTGLSATIAGLDRAANLQDAAPGRDYEADSALRARYSGGVYRLGAATVAAIRANLLQNVPGVTTATVIENDTDTTDADGRPPHSIECIVEGGEDAAVAAQIQSLKAAGITAYGLNSQLVQVDDGAQPGGEWHAIGYTRPVQRYVWVKCTVSLLSEEIFPADGIAHVAQILVQTGNALGIAQDVVARRFLGPIYDAVTGIASITLRFALSDDPLTAPDDSAYIDGNCAIGTRERAVFDATRIWAG